MNRLKNEKFLFLFIVFLHCAWIFLFRYFVTHDGPAHLYNANLITHMIFDNNDPASNIFEFTPGIVPNWIAHILLAAFNLLLRADLAEKAFLLSYVFLLAYSFRRLILTINAQSIAASYLIFPFVFSFTLQIGFFSFSFGIAVMFIVLAYFI